MMQGYPVDEPIDGGFTMTPTLGPFTLT